MAHKKNVAFVMWQDTKMLTLLTSAFFPKLDKTFCERRKKDGSKKAIQCHLAVLQYTERMGGVDRFDQKRTTYEVGRRSKRWWLRILYFCMKLGITNAFLLYKSNARVNNPISQLHFRLCVARGLINSYTSRKRRIESLAQHSKKRPKLSINRQQRMRSDCQMSAVTSMNNWAPGDAVLCAAPKQMISGPKFSALLARCLSVLSLVLTYFILSTVYNLNTLGHLAG